MPVKCESWPLIIILTVDKLVPSAATVGCSTTHHMISKSPDIGTSWGWTNCLSLISLFCPFPICHVPNCRKYLVMYGSLHLSRMGTKPALVSEPTFYLPH